MLAAIWAEYMKIRKSRIFWIMLLFFIFIPFMMALLMFVQKYPELSSKLGMIGTKATLLRLGEANWPNYFGLLFQTSAAIGLIGFGFITSWVFGREYADYTIKDILALPVSRSYIVIAKFILVIVWCLLLSFILFAFGIIFGRVIDLSDWSIELVFRSGYKYLLITLLTVSLCTPVAFFASFGRGYLLPIGFVILTLIIANFTGLVGLGPYFPWAIPGIYSVPSDIQLGTISILILFLTCILGLIGTIIWWRHADHK